ncbi:hypothetical protein K505DRAFT_390141 [Melanomma pulvis-pyrius CBS 109.77]|uniref:Uncharacterized protein n=1 Tax=Melanomma pulvis-pyrius CBS 109.77 TaxID=1314802 RepID=A0A6A6X3M8_9PLEO|nr:hypothetical protein K505DRAFT_390141 [Melanomma pulvis-pyrius CBS 109.77]
MDTATVTSIHGHLATIIPITVLDDENISYRSTSLGGFAQLLRAVLIDKSVATLVSEIILSDEFDGISGRSVLKFGDELYGFRRTMYSMSKIDSVTSAISDTNSSFDFDHAITASNASSLDGKPDHPHQVAFDALAADMVASDITQPTLELYLGLLTALLVVFPNLEYLYLPREWTRIFNAGTLSKYLKIGITENLDDDAA